MNWSLINNYHFSFLSFTVAIIILSYLFDIKGGKDTISLIDWIYDNVKYVISVGACPSLMSSGIQIISHTLTTNRKTTANIYNWICVRGIFTTRFHKQWNKKAIYYLRNFVFNLRLYWSTWSGALGKNTEKYSNFKA